MSPIRHLTARQWVAVFWAVVFMCIVTSTGALIVAARSNSHANESTAVAVRSERGFCISVKLIETNSRKLADLASHAVNPKAKQDFTTQYKESLKFAWAIRQIGIRCELPKPEVITLYNELGYRF